MDTNLALILSALATGAKEVANEAIKDAYSGLKTLIQRKFKRHSDEQSAQIVLSKYEEKPDIWREPLSDALDQVQANTDQIIVMAAQDLIKLCALHSPS